MIVSRPEYSGRFLFWDNNKRITFFDFLISGQVINFVFKEEHSVF
jgi:hypothetical protein